MTLDSKNVKQSVDTVSIFTMLVIVEILASLMYFRENISNKLTYISNIPSDFLLLG